MTKNEFLEELKPFYTHDRAIKLLIEAVAELLEAAENSNESEGVENDA